MNTFDGTDPKVDRTNPKVRNTIFFSCVKDVVWVVCGDSAVLVDVKWLAALWYVSWSLVLSFAETSMLLSDRFFYIAIRGGIG